MSSNLDLALTVRLRDQAGPGLARMLRETKSSVDGTERAVDRLARSFVGYRKEAQGATRQTEGLLASFRRLVNERAPTAMINGLRSVATEGTRANQALRGLVATARIAGQVAAGAAAAKFVLAQPAKETMDYGVRLAHMANTAFSERDKMGRISGKRELDTAIIGAVRIGGGTRDSAAEALDTLIASGAMSGKDAMGLLPTLMKSATAANADANQLAQIAIRGMQTFNIAPGDLGRVIDMAITGGQAGGFELRDMAKWLPQQMAAAKLSGMSGTDGMAKLIAANQAVAITAGTKDEAGNNLVNLLAKINSQDTAKDAKKLGIDLSSRLAKARGNGVDSLDAFVGIVDEVVGKDKTFQALQARLKTAKGSDRQSILESQANILEGSAIGKIIQDRQALMALIGIMGNRDYMSGVHRKVLAGAGASDRNFAVVAAESGFKVQQAGNEKVFATQTVFERLTPIVGGLADKFTEHARQYPGLTAATVGATTALTALAAAAGASSLASLLLGGRGGAAAGAATGLGSRLLTRLGITAAFAGGMPVTALAGTGTAGAGTVAGGVALSGAVGYAAGKYVVNPAINLADEKLGTSIGESIGRTIAKTLALFGHEDARRAIEIELKFDNGELTAEVNKQNARQARRN